MTATTSAIGGTASSSEIVQWDADALSQRIHARDVSCREVMHAYLARIDAVNPTYNAIVSLQPADALLRQAEERDAQLARGESMGWMHGMPQAIKDMSNAAGLPTTLGSPLMRDFVAKEDGLMAKRMNAAGCIVIGKTNTPEFGLGSHTFNEVFGVTRNAWDPTKSSGGSSGGAAVALAQRLLPVADGSDFMGSLRNPVGWNHVFGLRPSQGRVPMAPAGDVWVSQLGTEGPMGRTVRDIAQLLAVQAGRADIAPLSIAINDHPTWAEGLFDLKTVRIGWLGDLGGHLAFEDGILDLCRAALGRLADGGATVDDVAPAFAPAKVWDAWLVWRRVLVAARIAPFLVNPKNRALIKPEALWEHDQAQGLPATQFMAASTQRTTFYQQMLTLLETHEVLALPVAQVWPFDAALRWPEAINGRAMDTYHRWMEVVIYATFAGLPCISVPAGFGKAGLPMGVQLIGRPQGDARLLQIAAAYEARAQDILQIAPSQQAR
jgi:amidase